MHPSPRTPPPAGTPAPTSEALDAVVLREMCMAAGAHDVGFVSVDAPDLAEERPHIAPNYKAAYCMAVWPAGEEVMPLYALRKKAFVEEVLRPLQEKVERIYVVGGSDAEAHVQRRFPHKQMRRIHNGAHPRSIAAFERGLTLAFQRTPAVGLDAVFHFTFTGAESREFTVTIRDQTLAIEPGHSGAARLRITADAATWLGFLAKERSLLWAVLTGRIRLRGSLRLLVAFGRCFPA